MRIDILGVGFDNLTMTEAVARGCELLAGEGAHYVVTPNPEIVETCRADAEAMAAVNGADLVLPDGIGVIYGAKLLGTPLKSRVPGIEFGTAMLAHCAETGKKVFLFGAKPGVAEQAAKNLCKKLPGLQIAGTHDGYFTNAESDVIAAEIRASGADMALVCLGASLDVFAGVAQRAPEFYCKHNLEWFYRLIKNPSRAGRMMKLPLFLVHVAGEKRK